MKFDIDANGVLTVTAKDQATGKDQSIRIEGSSNLTDDEIERMKRDAEEHEADDKAYAEKMNKFNMWESQIFTAEQTLEDDKDKISEEDKKDLQEKLDAFKAVFNVKTEDRDMDACESASKELQTVQWRVSETLYKQANPDASTASNPFGQNGFDFTNVNPSDFAGTGQ